MTAFDTYLQAITVRAAQEACEDGSAAVEARHLLLAVTAERDGTVQQVLASAGLDDQVVREALDREFEYSLATVGVSPAGYALPRPSRAYGHPSMGASAKLALERCFAAAGRKKDLRPAHLLLGILQAKVGTVPRALALSAVDRAELVDRIQQVLDSEAG